MRSGFIAFLMTLGAVPIAQTQTPSRTIPCIYLRIEIDGDKPHEIGGTPEGMATAQVQLKDGDRWPRFFIDLKIRDDAPGQIRATIRNGRNPDSRVLDELDLQIGGNAKRTATDPAFGMAAIRIGEQKPYGSRCGPTE